jgi:hypothetical protein
VVPTTVVVGTVHIEYGDVVSVPSSPVPSREKATDAIPVPRSVAVADTVTLAPPR